jgi:release factor glutamine methyltransferase
MQNLLEVIAKTATFFAEKGFEQPRLEAELLFAGALGLRRLDLFLQHERPLTEAELERLRSLVARRARHEPLQYILGEAPFLELTLKVDPRALIPRPETEELAGALIAQLRERPPARVLDLGTGSGALALALARAFETARVVAVERSVDALALARENAVALGLEERVAFREGDWFGAVDAGERFGLIVANPPYLSAADWTTAQAEVREHEPRGALVADADGLADLEVIVAEAPAHLEPGGMLALESGPEQHDALRAAARAAGFTRHESRRDIDGRERFFLAWAQGME